MSALGRKQTFACRRAWGAAYPPTLRKSFNNVNRCGVVSRTSHAGRNQVDESMDGGTGPHSWASTE